LIATSITAFVLVSPLAVGQIVTGGPGGPRPLTSGPAPAAHKAAPAPKAAKPKAIPKSASIPQSPKTGLPKGEGIAADGQTIYAEKCAICHSWKGEATPGRGMGECWSTPQGLFGYVKRAMPLNKPGSLKNDEVYSLLAYLLSYVETIDKNLVMDANALSKVEMPAAKAALPSYCEGLRH
jgi:cytochrome c